MSKKKTTTLIVGVSSSMGEAIARALLAESHELVLAHSGRKIYRPSAGITSQIIKFDVTDDKAMAQALGECGALINNLVYCVSAPIDFKQFKDEVWEDYEEQWQAQVKGLWQIVHYLLAAGQPLKNIVAIGSSVTLTKPLARLGAYTAAKFALLGLVKSLAVELSPLGVRVNMVSPGATGTGLSKDWPSLLLRAGSHASPEMVASVVTSFLRDEDNRTGENISV